MDETALLTTSPLAHMEWLRETLSSRERASRMNERENEKGRGDSRTNSLCYIILKVVLAWRCVSVNQAQQLCILPLPRQYRYILIDAIPFYRLLLLPRFLYRLHSRRRRRPSRQISSIRNPGRGALGGQSRLLLCCSAWRCWLATHADTRGRGARGTRAWDEVQQHARTALTTVFILCFLDVGRYARGIVRCHERRRPDE